MRRSAPSSIDALVELTVREVIARASGPIATAIAKMAATELESQLESNVSVRGRKGLAEPSGASVRASRSRGGWPIGAPAAFPSSSSR